MQEWMHVLTERQHRQEVSDTVSSTVQSAPLHCLNCVVDVGFQYRTSVGRRPISEASRGILVNSRIPRYSEMTIWIRINYVIPFSFTRLHSVRSLVRGFLPGHLKVSRQAPIPSPLSEGPGVGARLLSHWINCSQGTFGQTQYLFLSTMFACRGLTFCALEYGKNVRANMKKHAASHAFLSSTVI